MLEAFLMSVVAYCFIAVLHLVWMSWQPADTKFGHDLDLLVSSLWLPFWLLMLAFLVRNFVYFNVLGRK